MAKSKSPRKPPSTPVESLRHKDKRKNIPTEELRDFVAEDEQNPRAVLYPRNPDLDPQLVWRGKDQQDSQPLEVPAVPIYIQEKIHPSAIIEDFRRHLPSTSGRGAGGEGGEISAEQLSLWNDFNGLPEDFHDRVDFYHHEANWQNRLILGNSLLVMTSLAEKENLKGQVQMIYMDPPYGIKFGSNWQVSTRKRDVKDGKAEDATRQPEQVQAFRDTWKLGIHSYLPYLRDRLVVARDLLTESGSIFVQIGDENMHLVRCMLDEVFGGENCIAQITCAKTTGTTGRLLAGTADYLVWYARDIERVKYRSLYRTKSLGGEGADMYTMAELPDGGRRRLTRREMQDPTLLPSGCKVFRLADLTSPRVREARTGYYPISFQGRDYLPRKGEWKTHRDGVNRLIAADRISVTGNTPAYVRRIDDFAAFAINNIWSDVGAATEKFYVVQTGTTILQRCVLMSTDPGDLVLDPTCGSGTTAYVAEQWGRRWITIDTSRVALTLARTRLMAARFPYYLLADTPEGRRKESELHDGAAFPHPGPLPEGEGDIRKGFVYKRVPHVTLKAIANNEEIDAIHAKWQEELEPLREKLNEKLGTDWQEWEIPRDLKDAHAKAQSREERDKDLCALAALREIPTAAATSHAKWWQARIARQKEIDASIARRAETELLYDQPYEDSKRVRVTGPFTVESLSPHRTISVEEKKRRAEVGHAASGLKIQVHGPDQFGQMILDNLRTAGVQNTIKKERLKFDSLQPYAGQWIHGEGQYTDTDAKQRRVAVCIGPEHGTVGPQLVKEAAKEAVQGVGFDMLIVCGFAFDPHVSEETKRYGKLVVLPARMNPDLSMGELLKKTGSGNLFMVFGEPDMEIRHLPSPSGRGAGGEGAGSKSSQIVVKLNGLDIYDPTTGEIRSSSTDDIACWFIDTDYNGESFFVRHAYFTGADEPYEKLKRALRAEIDEAAWSALYATASRPFEKPAGGRIAVKVINHYGDEVLKVYEV